MTRRRIGTSATKSRIEHGLEDPGDRQEGRVRGARDRRVVLVDDDDAGAAAHRDGRVGAERLALLDGRDVAADDPPPRLGGVLGRGDPRPDQAVVGAVGDGAVGRDERREQNALVEDAVREEVVELGAAGRVRALEVGRLQRLAQDGAREHARLRRRAALGLDGVEVADDEQDRRRGEREPDPGADGEAEDEPRRVARDESFGDGGRAAPEHGLLAAEFRQQRRLEDPAHRAADGADGIGDDGVDRADRVGDDRVDRLRPPRRRREPWAGGT